MFKSMFILNLFLLIFIIDSYRSEPSNLRTKDEIIDKLLKNFYNFNLNGTNYDQLKINLEKFQKSLIENRNFQCLKEKQINFESNNSITIDSVLNSSDDKISEYFNQKCLSSDSMVDLFIESKTHSQEQFQKVFKLILTQISNDGCDICNKVDKQDQSITRLETWGYGILFVGLISLSSLCGAVVIPFSKKKIYKKILMFLIAIAIGSLAGSGFLHLIPQAYGITEDEKYSGNHAYVWKSLIIMFGIYLFYLVEKFMNIMIQRRNHARTKQIESDNPIILESIGYLKTHDAKLDPNVEMRIHLSQEALAKSRNGSKRNNHGHSHGLENLNSVAPVAWMIIFGDGLHNFIDGLSIGAAFTESVFKGISICLAVICEEFPHELGDFAILINAGMSYPVALFFNFLSACCCFVGLAVGIQLGENFAANEWIYAIAGGMFIYISLCSMIPELNEMGEEIERDLLSKKYSIKNDECKTLSQNGNELKPSEPTHEDISQIFDFGIKIKILIIQNIGILLGFGFMLFMAIYSEVIAL
ncbi:unnamed protein product [Brachionus calyciflorus]|uniref:Uncharacterized protein n=1 Tax=Brachionus calyciflorus TaxID=104777 RepID=A0A814AF90_9BILA|nr:unnamed protein product [Brachionus calyciflorus]